MIFVFVFLVYYDVTDVQPTLLISASMPSAKKLIVHGADQTSIPSQQPIQEVRLTTNDTVY